MSGHIRLMKRVASPGSLFGEILANGGGGVEGDAVWKRGAGGDERLEQEESNSGLLEEYLTNYGTTL